MKNLQLKLYIPGYCLMITMLFWGQSIALAQSDSLTVMSTRWEIKKVASGIWLKHAWFNQNLFHSNQNISIIEIKMKRPNYFDVAAESKELKTTTEFGTENKALAAINGTFFDMKNGGSIDFIRINGKVLNENRKDDIGKRLFHQKAAVVTHAHKLSIESWNGDDNWEASLKGDDVMVTGPLLLKNKLQVPIDSSSFCLNRHPRTAVAIIGEKVLFIAVDGRNDKAAGMSLFELAKLLKWLGARDGINLDGGGSTTLWIDGFPEKGVINHPSDNNAMLKSKEYKPGVDMDHLAADEKKWDHAGTRPVANVLLLKQHK